MHSRSRRRSSAARLETSEEWPTSLRRCVWRGDLVVSFECDVCVHLSLRTIRWVCTQHRVRSSHKLGLSCIQGIQLEALSNTWKCERRLGIVSSTRVKRQAFFRAGHLNPSKLQTLTTTTLTVCDHNIFRIADLLGVNQNDAVHTLHYNILCICADSHSYLFRYSWFILQKLLLQILTVGITSVVFEFFGGGLWKRSFAFCELSSSSAVYA